MKQKHINVFAMDDVLRSSIATKFSKMTVSVAAEKLIVDTYAYAVVLTTLEAAKSSLADAYPSVKEIMIAEGSVVRSLRNPSRGKGSRILTRSNLVVKVSNDVRPKDVTCGFDEILDTFVFTVGQDLELYEIIGSIAFHFLTENLNSKFLLKVLKFLMSAEKVISYAIKKLSIKFEPATKPSAYDERKF